MVASDFDRRRKLQLIGLELESHFHNSLPQAHLKIQTEGAEFIPVTEDELTHVVNILPHTCPGPDGITAKVIKYLAANYVGVLLSIINSLEFAWVPNLWKFSKLVLVKKINSQPFNINIIRPLAVTSVLVKTIERVLYGHLYSFVQEERILNRSQVGFHRNCSICIARANFKIRIRQAMTLKQVSGLVTLDIAKAYDTLEHSAILQTHISLCAYLYGCLDPIVSFRSSFFLNDFKVFSRDQSCRLYFLILS